MYKITERQEEDSKTDNITIENRIGKLEDKFKKVCLLYGLPLSYGTAYLKHLGGCPYDNKEEEFKVKMYLLSDETNLIKKGESLPQQINQLLTER